MTKLQELKKQYERLRDKIEQLEEEKIDFSEYVGRDDGVLCIKRENALISRVNEIISYGETNRGFDDELQYEKTTLDNLKKGDVFIRCCDVDDMKVQDFSVFMGFDRDEDYIYQHIDSYGGVESIRQNYHTYNAEVYKFLRE